MKGYLEDGLDQKDRLLHQYQIMITGLKFTSKFIVIF